MDQVIKEVGLSDMVLKPADWNPVERQGWPTIKWMQEQNKRVLFFTDNRRSASISGGALNARESGAADNSYAYFIWSNMKESEFSTLAKEKIAQERQQSRNNSTSSVNTRGLRYLYLMNFFPDFILPTKKSDVSWPEIKNRVLYSKTNSEVFREALSYVLDINNGRYPNFIAVDFVNWGNALDLVNEINTKAGKASSQELDKMYAPF